MRVLIVGASKGIGLETTRQALEAGHNVRALARSATAIAVSNPSLEKIRGDALKTEDVEAALVGVDVVIQTLGVSLGDLLRPVHLFSDATRVLIAAMRSQGVKRLICVTGFGSGDSRASISCLQRLPFQIAGASRMRVLATAAPMRMNPGMKSPGDVPASVEIVKQALLALSF